MKILELVNSLEIGGAERVASCLALQLRSRGHHVHLIALRDTENPIIPKRRFEDEGVQVMSLGKSDGFSPSTIKRMTEYARRHQIEVVHTHNPLVHHYGAAAAKMADARVLVNTVHGMSPLLMKRWAKALFWAGCLFSDRVVAVSAAVCQALKRNLPLTRGRHMVICNGIETEAFERISPHGRGGQFVFGTVGRLVSIKDHRTLLEAFGIVYRRHGQCRLELLGDGELRQELERLSEGLGIAQAVQFRGAALDISGFLEGLDAFVLSSASEGLPLSLLEAMAAGLPIVSTAVGGIPAVVEGSECGWLCAPGAPAALAEQMQRAITADRRLYGEKGRAAVLCHYSMRTMIDAYERLFEEVLSSRK